MAQYKVVQVKERKTLTEDLEAALNEQAGDGWSFVEMERAHRGMSTSCCSCSAKTDTLDDHRVRALRAGPAVGVGVAPYTQRR